MAGFVQEFKEFAVKGNMMDLAIGVIIGGAFGKIVDSLVNDLIMPLIGALGAKHLDFSSLYINLSGQEWASYADAKKAGAAVIGIGQFFNICIQFLILAFIVFLLVKAINRLRANSVGVAAGPSATEVLLTEIRDELRNRPQ